MQDFSMIFPFILILAIVYGLAQYTKLFGDNKAIHGIIAIALAAMFLFSGRASEVIKIITPWFIILFIFIMFLLTAIKMFGASQGDILSHVNSTVVWWIIALSLTITLGAISHVFSGPGEPFSDDENPGNEEQIAKEASSKFAAEKGEFWGTLFHPKVLGMITLLLIASYTVRYLASAS